MRRIFRRATKPPVIPDSAAGDVDDATWRANEGTFEDVAQADAHVVTSRLDGIPPGTGVWHAPVLDIDMPCRLVESKTRNHHHLFIDTELDAEQYERLLEVLVDVGIVQAGFLRAYRMRGHTQVRLPGCPW